MRQFRRLTLAMVAALALTCGFVTGAVAQQKQARFAFIIGNDDYEGAALPTAANDAGLIAQTLTAAGFDVAGARNLDANTMRTAFQEFLQKVQAAGPGTVATVYLSGYGVQVEGENYLIPPGVAVPRDADVAQNGIRLFDLTKALASIPGNVNILTFDLAYPSSFGSEGQPLAPGLAMMLPGPCMLVAINTQPGAVAGVPPAPYGPYA